MLSPLGTLRKVYFNGQDCDVIAIRSVAATGDSGFGWLTENDCLKAFERNSYIENEMVKRVRSQVTRQRRWHKCLVQICFIEYMKVLLR